MNINSIIKICRSKGRMFSVLLTGAVVISCLSSCIDELLYDNGGAFDGEEVSVPLSLTVKPMESRNPATRAIEYIEATDDEKKIHDFWLIEYHENGTRIGLPRYFSEESGNLPEDIKIIIPRRDEDTFTCVMIANTNNPTLFNADNTARYSTLDDLRRFDPVVHNNEDSFRPADGKYLMMSGWTTITRDPATHSLSFDLIRNVCKVNVRLTAFDDKNLVYKFFQWKDVPCGKVFPHGNVDYSQNFSPDWIQHEESDTTANALKRVDLERGLDFYIPCNVWLPEGP